MSNTNGRLMGIDPNGPFFEMITSFVAATIGLGPLYDSRNPLDIQENQFAWYGAITGQSMLKNMHEVRGLCVSGNLPVKVAVTQLCCMLMNTAYESVASKNDNSPEFEVFFHIRNAVSHGNKFHFINGQPKHPAAWRTFKIDHMIKGSANPLHGEQCIGKYFLPGDALALLYDIRDKL